MHVTQALRINEVEQLVVENAGEIKNLFNDILKELASENFPVDT